MIMLYIPYLTIPSTSPHKLPIGIQSSLGQF